MVESAIESQCFLFSSNTDKPDKFFQGYCFIGNDYICGDEGRMKYEEHRSAKISGGEDGCYVALSSNKGCYSFSCDFSGNKKVFYYWEAGFWVVSNSILLIAEHLKISGIMIKPNYSQLSTIGIESGSCFNQIYSLNTFVDNVKLLPVGCTLNISSSGLTINPTHSKYSFTSYEEGLSFYIQTWLSRLTGLLNGGIEVQSDLTGGADSRTVFTLMKAANDLSDDEAGKPKFRSGVTPRDNLDFNIAKEIADNYGFSINEKLTSKIQRFSGETAYNSWKALCLGVYHPVYFPNGAPSQNVVRLGGAGAENHRPFYKFDSIESFIRYQTNKVDPKWLSYNVAFDLKNEFKRIQELESNIDSLIIHYRQYRNRMHGGRSPQYSTLFNPLGSKILDAVSELAGSERIKNGQLNYDLMATLSPSVLDIPFDDISKDFNETRRLNLTRLKNWGKVIPGNVYLGGANGMKPIKNTESALNCLNRDFQKAIKVQFVQDFFDSNDIEKAEETMNEALRLNGFSHAIMAQGIVAIIAAGLFDST